MAVILSSKTLLTLRSRKKMPRYNYSCEACEHVYTITHRMGENPEATCEECCEPLVRVLTIPLNYKIKEPKKKTGDVVKSFIEDSKEDLKNQVKEMKENR